MTQNSKILTGTYLIEKKWDVYWLTNKVKRINETMKYEKLYVILLQCFGFDYTKKILEAISEEKKVIVDFDKEKVKVVGQKDSPFHKSLSFYFKPQTVQNQLDSGEAIDIYGYLKEEN